MTVIYIILAIAGMAYEVTTLHKADKLRAEVAALQEANERLREILNALVHDENLRLIVEEPKPSPYRSWKTPRLG